MYTNGMDTTTADLHKHGLTCENGTSIDEFDSRRPLPADLHRHRVADARVHNSYTNLATSCRLDVSPAAGRAPVGMETNATSCAHVGCNLPADMHTRGLDWCLTHGLVAAGSRAVAA